MNPVVLCTDGQVRIVGSSNPSFGRVEVCVNQTWGTICDSAWNDNAASVICKQQGFSSYGIHIINVIIIIIVIRCYCC